MQVQTRIAQLQNLARDLRCWEVRDWELVGGWRHGGIPVSTGAIWADSRALHQLESDEFTLPADWPLDASYLEVGAFGYGLITLVSQAGDSRFYQLNEYNQKFRMSSRTFSVRANIAPIRDRSVGFVTLGDTWKTRVILVDPDVSLFCGILDAICDTARAETEQRLQDQLIRVAERGISATAWPTSSEQVISRLAHNENLRRHWSEVPVLSHPEPLSAAQRQSLQVAAEQMLDDLSQLRDRYPRVGTVNFFGYAHTDIEWLWPGHISVPAIIGQFANAMDQLDRFPDFFFGQTSAYLYAMVEDEQPVLFERLVENVQKERWELLSGMWVEPDANMLSGESIVRQLLHGQKYFQSRFGCRSVVSWLPDTFGFSANMPQLLAGAGIKYFFTTKLSYADTNPHPYSLFFWEGLDGTRVLSYAGRAYQCVPGAEPVRSAWENHNQGNIYPRAIQPIGYANGIGPTDADVSAALTLAAMPGLPSVRFSSAADYFTAAERETCEKAVPVWRGELYLEAHRGTFTSQGRTKVSHRHAEAGLQAAEVVSAMCALRTHRAAQDFTGTWRELLTRQTHDIIGGACTTDVHAAAEKDFRQIAGAADEATSRALDALAADLVPDDGGSGLLTVNPTLSWRPVRAVVGKPYRGGQRTEHGQVIATGKMMPPLSVMWEPRSRTPGVSGCATALENELVRLELADDGTIASLHDKRFRGELLQAPGNQISAYLDRAHFWDAWEMSENYASYRLESPTCRSIEPLEGGPHRSAIRVQYSFRDSTITQDIRMWSGSSRIDFCTRIEWHERRVLLRAYFPTLIRASHATYECAFGVAKRSTGSKNPWDRSRFEAPAYRFIDISEDDGGMALLNNGRYGHSVSGGVLGISLLRSPVFPDPLADEGSHSFTYSLFSHPHDWFAGGVLAEAEDLNAPLPATIVPSSATGIWQAGLFSGLPLALGAFKAAYDGSGLVLRAYEPAGSAGEARIELCDDWHLTSELNLLEDAIGEPSFRFGKHQVRTWLVTGS